MDKKKIIAIGGLIVVAGLFFSRNKEIDVDQAVRVTTITEGGESGKIQIEGVVVPQDLSVTSIYAEVPVVIEKIEATVGSRVKEGDVILSFTNEAKKEIEKSLQEMDIQLNSQEAIADSIKRQAKNAKYEAEVSKKQADVNRELLRADAISSLEVAKSEAIANREISRFQDLDARKEIENQKYNQLKEKKIELEKKFGFVEKDVRAPKDGIITELVVQNGAIINDGQKIYSISKEGDYKIVSEAPASLILSLVEGSKAIVKDLSKGDGKLYEGIISKVSKVARDDSERNKVIDLEIKLQDSTGLNPGFLTVIEVNGVVDQKAKMVDSFSVINEDNSYYVYQIENGRVKKRSVQIGIKTANKYEIVDLPVGSEIVVNPSKVKEGDKVKIVK
ncbi:MAG: efflux RND transporter periplasmic adaptor subunit [Fusobacteriaceae bacterium]